MANLSSSKIIELFAGVVELKRPPKLERIENRGRIYWRIILGKAATGKLVRRHLPVKDEDSARSLFGEICNRMDAGEFNSAARCFETHADLEFQTVRRKLGPHAASVTEAVDFYIKHHRGEKGRVTLNESIGLWEECVEREGGAEIYIRKMKDSYVGPFAKKFGHLLLQDLTQEIAETYIFKVKANLSPYSKEQTIQKLQGFLNRLADLGYYSREMNPFSKLKAPKERHGKDSERDRLLSPEMMSELLEFALSSDNHGFQELGVAVVLEGFCAIRRTEVERLQRGNLKGLERIDAIRAKDDFSSSENEIQIIVPKLQAKWAHKRNFMMPENAVVWLRYFVAKGWRREGPFFTSEKTGLPLSSEGISTRRGRFLKAFRQHCEDKEKEFPDYIQNAFRVSCASYGAKVFGVSKICEMLGHKRPEATFWKHYREDCDEKDAQRYFRLIPKEEARLKEEDEAAEQHAQQQARENGPIFS